MKLSEESQENILSELLVIADKTELLSDIINSPLYESADGSSSQKGDVSPPFAGIASLQGIHIYRVEFDYKF